MKLLTHSRMKAARACLRLHELQYVQGWRPRQTADALRFGTLVHAGLEAWWLAAKGNDDRLEAALSAVDVEADPYDRAKARALLAGYDARWSGQPYEVLEVEVEFRVPLEHQGKRLDPWFFAGKIDAIVRDEFGRVLVVEHKTSSEDVTPGSDYWRRLTLDSQISVYFDGATTLGHDVEGCLYDVIAKPGLKPLKATPPESRKYRKDGQLYAGQRLEDETPDDYELRLLEAIAAAPQKFFARGEVARLGSELEAARLDTWDTARLLTTADLFGLSPRNPDACVRYGRTCAFFDVCAGQASLTDTSRFERLNDPHPELSAVPEEADGHSAA